MAGDCGSTCPVPGGFYSYRPSIGGNTTFIAIYTLLILATIILGWRFGKLGYSVLLGTSHLLQMLAFVGRVLLHRAGDSQPYFLIFMLGTLLAPLFAASTIHAALPSILAVDARQSSRSCMLALISQIGMMGLVVSGLGLEVAGAVLLCYGQRVLQQTKSTVTIITGLGVQTFSLVIMFGMCAVASFRGSKCSHGHHALAHNDDTLFGANRRGLQAAGVVLLLHSVYRIVEMSLGVSGTLFQSEIAFMIANGAVPLVCCMLLSIFHPRSGVQPGSTVTAPPVYERRKGRPPPLTHGDDHPAHHGYSPNFALERSFTSQKSQSPTHPEMPSGSPGLPANPRPTQKSVPSPTPAQAHNGNPTSSPDIGNQNRVGKRGRAPQGMVKTDSLW